MEPRIKPVSNPSPFTDYELVVRLHEIVNRRFGVCLEEKGRSTRNTKARTFFVMLVRDATEYSLAELAEYMNMSHTSLSDSRRRWSPTSRDLMVFESIKQEALYG